MEQLKYLSPLSAYIVSSCKLLDLIYNKKGDSDEANKLREESEVHYYELTEDQIESAEDFLLKINEDYEQRWPALKSKSRKNK